MDATGRAKEELRARVESGCVLEANHGQFQARIRAVAAAIAIVLALLAASPAQAGRYVVRWGDTLRGSRRPITSASTGWRG